MRGRGESKDESSLVKLAHILFDEMERLAPGGSSSHWEKTTDWERGLYIAALERVLEERGLIAEALNSRKTSDDHIARAFEQRE